jgi:hypothetical protein
MKKYVALAIICILLVAVATAITTELVGADSKQEVKLTELQITRTSLPSNRIAPFQTTVSNVSQIQSIYEAAYQLPAYPKTPHYCPVDLGVSYHLEFIQAGKAVLQTDLRVGGCPSITLDDKIYRQANESFLKLFSSVAGLPLSQLDPMAPAKSCKFC